MIQYTARCILLFLTVAPFYLLLRRPWRFEWRRELALGCFVLYLVSLLVLALEGRYDTPVRMLERGLARIASGEGINLIPLRTIVSFFRYASLELFLINIVGNVVLFIPWGFGLALLWKRNQTPLRICALSLLLTLFIESVQLFIGRSVDVDDLLLNFVGGCVGGLFYAFLRKRFPQISVLAKE